MEPATRPPGGRADAAIGTAANDGEGDPLSRRKCLSVMGTALLAVLACGLPELAKAQASAPAATPVVQQAAASGPAELKIANRRIFTMRANVFGSAAAERAEASADRIHELVRRGGPLQV